MPNKRRIRAYLTRFGFYGVSRQFKNIADDERKACITWSEKEDKNKPYFNVESYADSAISMNTVFSLKWRNV